MDKDYEIWGKVNQDPSGCWLYTGCKNPGGYGSWRRKLAHRVAWSLMNGPIPAGMFIIHSCHVRHCINPAHLRVGDAADNGDDTAMAGRQTRRKLNNEQVRSIRAMLAAKVPQRLIAEKHNISQTVISWIKSGKVYKYEW